MKGSFCATDALTFTRAIAPLNSNFSSFKMWSSQWEMFLTFHLIFHLNSHTFLPHQALNLKNASNFSPDFWTPPNPWYKTRFSWDRSDQPVGNWRSAVEYSHNVGLLCRTFWWWQTTSPCLIADSS